VANSIIQTTPSVSTKSCAATETKAPRSIATRPLTKSDEAFYVVEELKRTESQRKKTGRMCHPLPHQQPEPRHRRSAGALAPALYCRRRTRFYERQEIKDIIAYLKLIFNGKDGQSLQTASSIHLSADWANHPGSRARLRETKEISLAGSLPRSRAHQRSFSQGLHDIERFASMVQRWQERAKHTVPSEILEHVLKETGYIAKLEEDAHSSKASLPWAASKTCKNWCA